MASTTTTTRDRALALLGSGNIPIGAVASALGVTDSAISQLLSQEDFSAEVAMRRYEALAKNTTRDAEYDSLEDQIIEKLKSQLGMIWEPMKLVKILQVVNAAKRRGASAPVESSPAAQTIITLNMPTKITHHYTTNINNQVVAVSESAQKDPRQETLVTIQSSQMDKLLQAQTAAHTSNPNTSSVPALTG